MADVSPVNVWPEIAARAADIALDVLWQRFSTDDSFQVTTSSSAATHWSVALSTMVGPQPYPGSASRMLLKGSRQALIQYQQEAADTTFWYHADVWLGNDGSGNALLVPTSSEEAFYFGSSSSTAEFVLSTVQAATNVHLGTAYPVPVRGVRLWEAD